MSRLLIADIGAGTIDILYYDMSSGMHFKAVGKSPVQYLADRAAAIPGKLLVTGVEMGGGAMSAVLKARAQEGEVVMSASSAATIHHLPDRVRSFGIRVVPDGETESFREDKKYHTLNIGDVDMERLKSMVESLGVPFEFDIVGFCVQDHGVAPKGVSHLDFRHNLFKSRLDQDPSPHSLLYRSDEIPETFNRLRAVARCAREMPADEVYVMDSGMAAVLGASMDEQAIHKDRIMIVDVATSHTVGAAMERHEIAGFFEYHTHDITLDRLETLLVDLADGKLDHDRILDEGGHGAYTRKFFGFKNADIILATGPKRRMIRHSRLPFVFGAPLGDNMMTGTVGVLEAIRRRKGFDPIMYV